MNELVKSAGTEGPISFRDIRAISPKRTVLNEGGRLDKDAVAELTCDDFMLWIYIRLQGKTDPVLGQQHVQGLKEIGDYQPHVLLSNLCCDLREIGDKSTVERFVQAMEQHLSLALIGQEWHGPYAKAELFNLACTVVTDPKEDLRESVRTFVDSCQPTNRDAWFTIVPEDPYTQAVEFDARLAALWLLKNWRYEPQDDFWERKASDVEREYADDPMSEHFHQYVTCFLHAFAKLDMRRLMNFLVSLKVPVGGWMMTDFALFSLFTEFVRSHSIDLLRQQMNKAFLPATDAVNRDWVMDVERRVSASFAEKARKSLGTA